VHVPKAAIDVDDLSDPRKYEIGRAGERVNMQAVSEGMREPADR